MVVYSLARCSALSLPYVGETEPFEFNCGGKQGGVETPDQWRALIDFVMEPLVETWNAFGYGFRLPADTSDEDLLVHHASWADNAVLFADAIDVLR